METFEDLKFEPHRMGGEHARLYFPNGYGVSVVFGERFYSNGVDTYELAMIKGGHLCYHDIVKNDVLGYLTKEEVTKIMKEIQALPNEKV